MDNRQNFPEQYQDLAKLFAPVAELRIIGGAVRNLICQLPINDYDCAVNCHPDEILKICKEYKLNLSGLSHGVIGIVFQGEYTEIAATRSDIATNGRRAVVAYTKDWALDAVRRDFTINSLSMDINGKIHDYCHGCADFHPLNLQFIGNAKERIAEDNLRIFRFFRFLSVLPCQKWQDPAEFMNQEFSLRNLSIERIEGEMQKILLGDNWHLACNLAHIHGLFRQLNWQFNAIQADKIAQMPIKINLAVQLLRIIPNFKPQTWGKKFSQSCQIIMKNADKTDYYRMIDELEWHDTENILQYQWLNGAISLQQYQAITSELAIFTKPKFPLSGHDLPYNGKNLGEILQITRTKWQLSKFSLSKDDLLKETKKLIFKK